VALERQSIEKKDFPIGRRGYDPDAVDAHLRAIADDMDELKRSSRRRTETLASTASDQVRAIVEAAENSAAEIQSQAEEEAREIRAEAASEAKSTREQATAQAREYVGKVSESTTVMLQRLDAMESELGALIESLRTGSNRLNADLQLLETNLTEVRESVAPRADFEPEPAVAPPPPPAPEPPSFEAAPEPPLYEPEPPLYEPEPEPPIYDPEPAAAAPPVFDEPAASGYGAGDLVEEAPVSDEPPMYDPDAVAPAELEPEPFAPAAPAAADGAADDDAEGARLIALNMALNGTPRDETDRYLAENFELRDRAGLLDEVYASVEG
jgi:DivIVA domain-containing protein